MFDVDALHMKRVFIAFLADFNNNSRLMTFLSIYQRNFFV